MMLTSQKHKSYQESGIPDLGEIPEHWKTIRNRFLFQEQNERSLDGQETHLCMSQRFGLVPSDEFEDKTLQSESYEGARLCKKGDLVLNRLKAHLSVFSTAPCDGLVSPDYSVFRLRDSEMVPKYFEHLFKTPVYLSEFNRRVRGIVAGFYRLYTDDFNDVRAICPPTEDQKRIVAFLDRKTSEIDQAIAQKQRFIKLLQQQKAILINQAVTKGLNLNASMHDSGVQWLGEIPEHWEVWRSKRLFSQRKEFAQSDDVQLSATQAYGVIPQEEYEDRIGRKVTKVFQHLEKRRHVEVGDFVISMRSFEGGLERAWAKGCIRSSYVVLKPSAQINVDFFSYVFKSQAYIGALQTTANFIRDGQDLNFDNFCAIDLVLPPIEEQQAIAQALNVAVADNAKIAEQAQKEIDLLREFRQIVIANTVTGKMKI